MGVEMPAKIADRRCRNQKHKIKVVLGRLLNLFTVLRYKHLFLCSHVYLSVLDVAK
jgi:hypothetical protein